MQTTPSSPAIAYSLTGPDDAPVIVFVNGLGGTQAAFGLQIRAFREDHRVLVYDHRGVGGSEVVDSTVTMADYAADLVRLLDHLSIEQACFVGLSFGGRVLQELAVGWPERVSAMIISGTSAGGRLHVPGDADAHRVLRIAEDADETVWAETIAPVLFGEAYRTKHPDRIQALARWRARYRPDPRGVARQWEAWEKFDMSDRLSSVSCPVLVLHGTDDGLSPEQNARNLAEGLSNVQLVFLDGVGHSPNVEAPERFHKEIRNFFTWR